MLYSRDQKPTSVNSHSKYHSDFLHNKAVNIVHSLYFWMLGNTVSLSMPVSLQLHYNPGTTVLSVVFSLTVVLFCNAWLNFSLPFCSTRTLVLKAQTQCDESYPQGPPIRTPAFRQCDPCKTSPSCGVSFLFLWWTSLWRRKVYCGSRFGGSKPGLPGLSALPLTWALKGIIMRR